MVDIDFKIETAPMQENYIPASKSLNPSLFIAIAAEGQEEMLYLSRIRDVTTANSSTLMVVLLNEFYMNPIEAISLSHPKHRYELIEQWRIYYSTRLGITNDDEEWLICDRDDSNFKSQQYDSYVHMARKNPHFHFIVSNPAFQLWLLLHFTSQIPVFQSSKCKDKIRMLEAEIRKYAGAYTHGSLDFGKYATHVRDAMKNSQQYSTYTMEDLKDMTGTHFFKLLEFIESQIGKSVF